MIGRIKDQKKKPDVTRRLPNWFYCIFNIAIVPGRRYEQIYI